MIQNYLPILLKKLLGTVKQKYTISMLHNGKGRESDVFAILITNGGGGAI